MFFKSLVATKLVKQLGRKSIEKEEELREKNSSAFSNPGKVTVRKGKFYVSSVLYHLCIVESVIHTSHGALIMTLSGYIFMQT